MSGTVALFPRSARVQTLDVGAMTAVELFVARHARVDAITWASVADRSRITWNIDADADAAIATALAQTVGLDVPSIVQEQQFQLYWIYITHYADTRRELIRGGGRRTA